MNTKSKLTINNSYLLRTISDSYVNSVNGVPIQSIDTGKAVQQFSITFNLTSCTVSPNVSVISEGQSLTFTFTATNSSYTEFSKSSSGATVTWTSITSTQWQAVVSNPTGNVTLTCSFSTPSICLLEDTQVLLADHTYKKIQDITYDDLVMTYNPYLKDFIGEYPTIITETTDGCTSLVRRITLENGKTLDICWSHTVLIKDEDSFKFRPILAGEDENNLIGLEVACYDVTTNTLNLSKIVSCELLLDKLFAKAYNVFVPLHGTIITNDMLSGGDFLLPLQAFDIHKILYKDGNRLMANTEVVDLLTSAMKDTDEVEGYLEVKKLFTKNLSYRLYLSSIFQYTKAAERLAISLDLPQDDLNGLNDTLMLWGSCYKTFPAINKVKIEDMIYEVPEGDYFTFPEGNCRYLDLSSNKIYNPGDKKLIHCSIVVKIVS